MTPRTDGAAPVRRARAGSGTRRCRRSHRPGTNRAPPMQGGRRRREKAGTDGTTESDHLQLPAMEAFVIARVFAREPLVGDV